MKIVRTNKYINDIFFKKFIKKLKSIKMGSL